MLYSPQANHIPKEKIHHTEKLLPEHIRNMIKQRNTRQQYPKDPLLTQQNANIDKEIQNHKQALWKQHLTNNWDHKTNSHTLWKTLNGLAHKKEKKKTQTPNITINFDNKTAITDKQKARQFNKQFTNHVKHTTQRRYRIIDRFTNRLKSTPIQITIEQTSLAIKQAKNNNSTGPENINIKHLKHLGVTALTYLTTIFNLSLNTNTITHTWKIAKIIPIPKPGKDITQGTSYRPIALLSPIAKTLEKIILPHITSNTIIPPHQHGFRHKHSTTTALHEINNTITKGLKKRTIAIALDLSKAFDTVNLHTLIHKLHKLHNTNIPYTILKYIANYIKGRKQYTLYNDYKSALRNTKTGVPQGGILSPTLFNIYTTDLPTPTSPDITTVTYADDTTVLSTHTNPHIAQQQVKPYLQKIYNWTKQNQLTLNASKTTTTLFTPDPAEYNTTLTLQINNIILPTNKESKT